MRYPFKAAFLGILLCLLSISTVLAQGETTPEPPEATEAVAIPTDEVTETPTEEVTEQPGETAVEVTAITLGDLLATAQTEILRSPYDETTYTFGLPNNWALSAPVTLNLSINATSSSDFNNAGFLEVFVNDVTVGVVPLTWTGDRAVSLEVPEAALRPLTNDDLHRVRVILETDFDCNSGFQSAVVIGPDSVFTLPHTVIAPSTDLRYLPLPFFQQSVEVDSALIVVPDAPTSGELQAALTTAAGFGRLTNNELLLGLVTASELTDAQRASQNLIFVGQAGTLPVSSELRLPDLSSQSEDGALQLVVSPWNEQKVVLVVSGGSDTAVVKAAQALTTGEIRPTADDNSSAVVQAVNADAPTTNPVDSTLQGLGYSTETIARVGNRTLYYHFNLPFDVQFNEDGYFDLRLAHSELLDYGRSGVTVRLNGEPIGSVRLSDETANLSESRILLPATALRGGDNELAVSTELRVTGECVDFRSENAWLTVRENSNVHFPTGTPGMVTDPHISLNLYPAPFTLDNALNDLLFVLPHESPEAWRSAALLVSDLGDRARGQLLTPQVVFDSEVAPERLTGHHVLVFGELGAAPFIEMLNAKLAEQNPDQGVLPFDQSARVTYQLPENRDIGYLALMQSPWDARYVVMTVLGQTELGLTRVSNALLDPTIRRTLLGNMAIIDDRQVLTDRVVFASTPLPEAQAQSLTTVSQQVEVGPRDNSQLFLIAAVISSLIIVVTLIFGVIRFSRRRG